VHAFKNVVEPFVYPKKLKGSQKCKKILKNAKNVIKRREMKQKCN
jgi:hypothetical protein